MCFSCGETRFRSQSAALSGYYRVAAACALQRRAQRLTLPHFGALLHESYASGGNRCCCARVMWLPLCWLHLPLPVLNVAEPALSHCPLFRACFAAVLCVVASHEQHNCKHEMSPAPSTQYCGLMHNTRVGAAPPHGQNRLLPQLHCCHGLTHKHMFVFLGPWHTCTFLHSAQPAAAACCTSSCTLRRQRLLTRARQQRVYSRAAYAL